MKDDEFDVVIIGAGIAGCATALALRAAGITDVLLAEAGLSSCGDWVGESLPPDVSRLLRALDLWDIYAADGHEPCWGSCAAWGSPSLGYNDFFANGGGHGWHLNRPRFNRSLYDAVTMRGITIQRGRNLSGVRPLAGNGGFRLTFYFNGGETSMNARHVVDASGCRGAFSRCLGHFPIQHDLLVFVSARVTLAPNAWPSRLTMTETSKIGWWYGAKLPGNQMALALATDPENLRALRLKERAVWLNALAATRHIAPRLAGKPFDLGPLAVRAAPVYYRDMPSGANWTAVGDSAAACDPLGSQGIFKALEDGIQAAEVIVASLNRGEDQSAGYATRVKDDFEEHLRLRRYFYKLETQWPQSAFWINRNTAPGRGKTRRRLQRSNAGHACTLSSKS